MSAKVAPQSHQADVFKIPKILVELGLLERRTEYLRTKDSATKTITAAGEVTKFELPKNQARWMIGLSRVPLQFNATTASTGGATYDRFENDIKCLIDHVVINSSGNKVIESRAYNIRSVIEQGLDGDVDASLLGSALNGMGSRTDRSTWGPLGLLYIPEIELFPQAEGSKSTSILPVNLFADDLEVEVHWAAPATCMETDGTATYTLANARLRVDYVLPNPNLIAEMKRLIASGGYRIPIEERTFYTNNLTNGATLYNFHLSVNKESVKKLIHVMRTAANVNSAAVNDKLSTFNHNNLQDYIYNIQGYKMPSDVVRCTNANCAEAIFELLRCSSDFSHYKDTVKSRGVISRDLFLADGCVFGYNFSRNPYKPDVLGGVKTLGKAIDVEINLSAALGADTNLHTFAYTDMVLRCSEHGVLQIVSPSAA